MPRSHVFDQRSGGSDGILVVGTAVVDMAYRIRRLPRPGETLLASARTMDVGGKGLNQAVAARRAGAKVRLVAPVGGDEAARRIRDVLVRAVSTRLSWWLSMRRPTSR